MLDNSIWRHRTVCLLIGKTSGGSNAFCKEICWRLAWIWLLFCLLIPSGCMLWCYSALEVFLSVKVMLLSFYYFSYNGGRIMWNIPKYGLFITKKPAVRAIVPFSHQIKSLESKYYVQPQVFSSFSVVHWVTLFPFFSTVLSLCIWSMSNYFRLSLQQLNRIQ